MYKYSTGIGFKRYFIIKYAKNRQEKKITMIDDNVFKINTYDIQTGKSKNDITTQVSLQDILFSLISFPLLFSLLFLFSFSKYSFNKYRPTVIKVTPAIISKTFW